jgi:hypothetical protein
MHIDSVCDLAADPSLVGEALSRIPLELRREADRWEDPWAFLLGVRESYMPTGYRQVFRAAQSQRSAWRRLARIVVGADKLTKSWFAEMLRAAKAGDVEACTRAMSKVFGGYWRVDRGKHFLAEIRHELGPPAEGRLFLRSYSDQLQTAAEMRKEIQEMIAVCETKARKLRRKHGRVKAERLLRPARSLHDFMEQGGYMLRVGATLIQGWMRNPEGVPGYCLFGDAALLEVMKTMVCRSLEMDTLRKVRQLFGLKKAPIFVYQAWRNSKGEWELRDRQGRVTHLIHPPR